MKLKPEVRAKLERAFDELSKSGYLVQRPTLDLDSEPVYAQGKAIPVLFVNKITVNFSIVLPESVLELEQ